MSPLPTPEAVLGPSRAVPTHAPGPPGDAVSPVSAMEGSHFSPERIGARRHVSQRCSVTSGGRGAVSGFHSTSLL